MLEVPCSYEEMERDNFEPARIAEKEQETKLNDTTSETWRNPRLEMLLGYSATPLGIDKPGASNPSLPVDLFPNRPQSLWDFIEVSCGPLDWSAPLHAMYELMKQSPTPSKAHLPSAPSISNDSLDNILAPDEILHLTSMYAFLSSPVSIISQ